MNPRLLEMLADERRRGAESGLAHAPICAGRRLSGQRRFSLLLRLAFASRFATGAARVTLRGYQPSLPAKARI
jgi:hypothetical protein